MADYFPLIVNATTGVIEELPAGDNLNLANSNIVNATIPIGSLYIPGGANGQVLTTDGAGNLSWGPGGGGNVTAIDPIYFVAPVTGNNQVFTDNALLQYTANTDITLFRNGVLVQDTNYTLTGNALTLNIVTSAGDSVEIIRQFVATANIGGVPAGVNTEVQFNNAGNFGANASFTFNSTTSALVAGNSVTANFFIGDGGLLSNIAGGANLSNGTSNIVIGNSSNITFSVAGISNVLDLGSGVATFNTGTATNGNVSIIGTLSLQSDNISLGTGAGQTNQSPYGVAVGTLAGSSDQGSYGVAVGYNAGSTNQGDNTVAIGEQSGVLNQSISAVAVGSGAGAFFQGADGVAVGFQAGGGTIANSITGQAAGAVAVGSRAGVIRQGAYSVALGYRAGISNQANNSIVINATGANLNNTQGNSLVIKPIANNVSGSNVVLSYNDTTGEITQMNAGLIPRNVVIVNTPTYNVQRQVDEVIATQFNGNVTLVLPTPVPVGQVILVKDILGGAGNRRINPVQVVVGNTITDRLDGGVSWTMNTNFSAYNFVGITPNQWGIF